MLLTERVEIDVADGTSMAAFQARPPDPAGLPGVIVLHELFGVTMHVREVCERLAGFGCVALAPDLYHRAAPGAELPHDAAGRERGFALLHELTRDQAVADVQAAAEHLRAQGRPDVGVLGLSVGGHVAFLAASRLDLDPVITAYPSWLSSTDLPLGRPTPTLALASGIRGRVLVLVGAEDHVADADERRNIEDALRAGPAEHEVVVYPGASHGFLCDRRDTFHADAAADAWQRIEQALLRRDPGSGSPDPGGQIVSTRRSG
jgi:carboxymethylenebutenolidase